MRASARGRPHSSKLLPRTHTSVYLTTAHCRLQPTIIVHTNAQTIAAVVPHGSILLPPLHAISTCTPMAVETLPFTVNNCTRLARAITAAAPHSSITATGHAPCKCTSIPAQHRYLQSIIVIHTCVCITFSYPQRPIFATAAQIHARVCKTVCYLSFTCYSNVVHKCAGPGSAPAVSHCYERAP